MENKENDDIVFTTLPVVDDTIEEDGLPKDFARMLELHMLAVGHDLKPTD